MKTALLLLSLVAPAPAAQNVYEAPQDEAPLQMIYDATPDDLEAQDPAPLLLALSHNQEPS
jgi:hypothetical protein